MIDIDAKVLSSEVLAEGLIRIILHAPEIAKDAKPGQFIQMLVPGYGAQGATGKDIAGCFDANGNGAIVNASRSILCAWKKREGVACDAAARDGAIRMREDLCKCLAEMGKAIK